MFYQHLNSLFCKRTQIPKYEFQTNIRSHYLAFNIKEYLLLIIDESK